MKITLFTSNQPRHNYLINNLSKVCKKIYVIQEVSSHKFSNKKSIENDKIINKYFNEVNKAELKCFGINPVLSNNIEILTMPKGDINNYNLNKLKFILKSDLFVIFGSSLIKNNLFKFLIKKNTFNIHMGISPYYRGTACNFWATYDENYHLVGASIIKLSKKVDAGDIFYHDIAPYKKNKFLYTMNAVKKAIDNFSYIVGKNNLKKFTPVKQNFNLTIRESKEKDFTAKIIKNFNRKKTNVSINKNKINLINNQLLSKLCKP